ncbi:MAG TPA: bifunctional ornithine acetyltransferase/N-acetylglutamate synthase [Candidatus Limnocylindrales bacterium]|nr:bifunctional ornithine acetyltransferase/N-acetylglutamate synthase [Candidatus Limnocylindrales bacterium]
MTIATRPLDAIPSELPRVERLATIPLGFVAGAGVAGIKASGRPDLAIIATKPDPDGGRLAAAAAAVFTPNAFAAAPVRLSQAHLAATEAAGNGRFGWATAVISTSGSANAATGAAGDADQAEVAELLAAALGTSSERTLLLSTGVIGTRLPLDRVREGIAAVAPTVSPTDGGLAAAADALRTTDSVTKAATTTLTLPDVDGHAVRPVRVTGIAKGVGMIHPRMATMLSILLTDASVHPATLHGLLRPAVARTWNQLSVDGDTSTNDTVFILASGAAGAADVTAGTREAVELGRAIEAIARDLARQQAADGEGATTLITCQVSGAGDDADARAVARAVVSSSLVKAAAHGRDPNWGRIAGAAGNAMLADEAVLAAAGLPAAAARSRAGTAAELDPDRLRIAIAGHLVFDGMAGGPIPFDRDAARAAMNGPELLLRLDLGLGNGTGEAFGCDLTETYVTENSEYTT